MPHAASKKTAAAPAKAQTPARGRTGVLARKPVATPVKVPKTGELIARALRNRIVRGELVAGSTLPSESELMTQFGISRPTLREALRILESESLLTIRRGSRGGPIINLPDPETAARHFGLVLQARGTTLTDVYRTRQLIEPPAVRAVVENASKKAPVVLREILEAEKTALEARDMERVSHEIARFHDAIVELTGYDTLMLVARLLNSIYEKHVSLISITVGPEFDQVNETRKAFKAHERLIALIESGDADAAVKFWRTHLEGVRQILFKHADAARVVDVLE